MKVGNTDFSKKYFTVDFLQFCSTTVKICLFELPAEYFPINLKHFKNFLEISQIPKILNLKLFGNSYIYLLVKILYFPFIFSEQKLCQTMKKFTNIFCMIDFLKNFNLSFNKSSKFLVEQSKNCT